jgi:tRNA-dihydrouridine synthase B
MKPLVISPMAGVTDAPFRAIALKYGADYGISEMLNAKTSLWDSQKTQQRLKTHFKEPKRILQIAGASPEVVVNAATNCSDYDLDGIEINMGCPAKKVCNVLAGSALLKDEKLVANILSQVVKAAKVPVYLKTRLGWDHSNKNILTIAKIAEESGIQSLTIHGRTRCDMYNNYAQFDLIAQVKARINIPVFANGDITTPEKAKLILEQTNSDGLYIGRGALGKPWLFQQIKDYLTTGHYQKFSDYPALINLISEHLNLIYAHYGEYLGVRISRKHVKWYKEQNSQALAKLNFSEFSALETKESHTLYLQNLLEVENVQTS